MPISWPWNAPELAQRQHGLSFAAAKAADVYSVGLVCFWLMLGETKADVSVTAWTRNYRWLSRLKDSDELTSYCQSAVEKLKDIDSEMKSALSRFFKWTITSSERPPSLVRFIDDIRKPVVCSFQFPEASLLFSV